jgi:subfamily B ATP-binding cassette protein MsbA
VKIKPTPAKNFVGKTLVLDDRSRGLLERFCREWILPRWRELTVALVWTGLLAAATGTYPMIIKTSFDTLMKGNTAVLPYVLGAIIGMTALRSLFLYLQTVRSNSLVMRLTTDMQKLGFAHLINSDFARLTRDTPGRLVSRLTNDITFIQQAT